MLLVRVSALGSDRSGVRPPTICVAVSDLLFLSRPRFLLRYMGIIRVCRRGLL